MPYEIELISLRCNDAQESRDEPYLRVNNRTAWGPTRMHTGDTLAIGRCVAFNRDVRVELREVDWSPDDHFGTMHLSVRLVRAITRGAHPPLMHPFHRDLGILGDASYTLTYDLHRT